MLISDGQTGNKNKRKISLDGKPMQEVELPGRLPKHSKLVSIAEFELDQLYDNLSLWLDFWGDTKIYLNDVEVLSQHMQQTLHYSHFSLSQFSRYLRKGKNTLRIVVNKAHRPMSFDYGLKAF